MTYDTAEIRSAARKILSCAQKVNNDAEPKMRKMRNEVASSFEGATANALSERLKGIDSDVQAISSGLEALYRALMRYAAALDEADQRIANSL